MSNETMESWFHEVWYPVVNDLIGGWCVANRNASGASELDTRRDSDSGARIIGDFLTEEVATYVCLLHNRNLLSAAPVWHTDPGHLPSDG